MLTIYTIEVRGPDRLTNVVSTQPFTQMMPILLATSSASALWANLQSNGGLSGKEWDKDTWHMPSSCHQVEWACWLWKPWCRTSSPQHVWSGASLNERQQWKSAQTHHVQYLNVWYSCKNRIELSAMQDHQRRSDSALSTNIEIIIQFWYRLPLRTTQAIPWSQFSVVHCIVVRIR